MSGGACLGSSSNTSIGVEGADGSVAFLKNATSLFEQGFDVLDKLFLVKLLFGCTVGFFNELEYMSV